MTTTTASITTPGKAFDSTGKHVGAGPWLDIIREANSLTEGTGVTTFGAPEIVTDSGRYVETYPDFTVDLGPVGDTGDSPVTITALTASASVLLAKAIAGAIKKGPAS